MEFTKHVKDRYAERMAGRDTTIDINTYVAQNDEKIIKDITKLIEHSDVIYSGVCHGGKDPVVVRRSGTWIIIMNSADKVVITLYKINLGLTEELNKTYVDLHIQKLNEDKEKLAEKKEKVREEVSSYRQAIDDNSSLISEYEALVKRLKLDNKYYEEIIKNKNAEFFDLENNVRTDIDALTKRMEF